MTIEKLEQVKYTYKELKEKYDGHTKCNNNPDCYQCRYITFEKGKDCTDKYIEHNYTKVLGDNDTELYIEIDRSSKWYDN